jgi:hypothetical protein
VFACPEKLADVTVNEKLEVTLLLDDMLVVEKLADIE